MRYRSFHYDQPSEYYLYLPQDNGSSGEWSLFVGVHGEHQQAVDCFDTWEGYANDFEFALLCPAFQVEDGAILPFEGERVLADILTALYGKYHFKERFFIAGFSTGGSFAVHYGYRYPQALNGVAAIASAAYPEPAPQAQELPLLLIVGDEDEEALNETSAFQERIQEMAFPSRLIELPGVDHRMTNDARRLILEFFRQVSRLGFQ
jgi:poly(3-hydroxybutyrate) depolymerase